ncbi:MAG TPA: bifunctional diaminohydroxyphosphoribosylaminopyrimidine deaminase/5-amino-6-(5-phosphoribosylamino)uracil reductase RibD [Candidatus Nitrosotalea sp.]|nr:bifunctional diaminohydroxyphosphoribosylaminopyrimidine deaminase/5-amino-6-(5-phosphoribosylamino)uracil reductase RibD [Candidatus Nitrosotalea sp.]
MGKIDGKLTPLDVLYLQRAYELAARGVGSTAPNPPVGAVVVRDGRVVGEGYHHRAGEAHAEPNALAQAGVKSRGATMYVSLEPCRHFGRTPPCTHALIEAGIGRVVAGTLDPSGNGGAAELRERGLAVEIAGDAIANDLVEIFARASGAERPYVALKMAMSLDGRVAQQHGSSQRIGSDEEQQYVRALRTVYDAILVGAGTVRIDDPRLTVRPPHDRTRPYLRVVAGGLENLAADRRVFVAQTGYARTMVLVPAGLCDRYESLHAVAEILEIGPPQSQRLDLPEALRALRARGIFSLLCEGGPRLAAGLLSAGLVDRVYWAIAPRFCGGEDAVPVLSGANLEGVKLHFDRAERAGPDVILSGVPCSAE